MAACDNYDSYTIMLRLWDEGTLHSRREDTFLANFSASDFV